MYRIIIFIILAITICIPVNAQKTVVFATIDAKMTLHYTSSNWDSVIYYGKLGLANNIDDFYLRKRLGEAYYYKQNYISAIPHFENAMKENSKDIATQEFLYYCYLFSGRESNARDFQTQMSETALKDIKEKKNNCIDNIYFETGTSLSNNFNKNQNNNFKDKQNIFEVAEMSGNVSYDVLDIKALLGHKVSIYAGGSFMNEQMKTVYDISVMKPAGRIIMQRDTIAWKPKPPPGNYTYDTIIENRQDFKNKPLLFKYNNTLHQNEFYLNCNIHAAKGMDITPFIHLLITRLTMTIPHSINFVATDSVETHTQFYFPPPMGGMTDTVFHHDTTYTVTSDYSFQTKDTSFVNYSMGIVLNKSLGNFATSIFGSYSNLNDRKQEELGISATWFPLGNLNLYFYTTVVGFKEQSKKKLVVDFLAGKKIYKNIWMEGNVTLGEMNNFTEKNGFVVNNNPDIIKFRCGISPFMIFKKMEISLRYQYLQKEGNYVTFTSTTNYRVNSIKYQNHLIIAGIKWNL